MQKYIGTAIKKDVNNPSPAGETPAVGASVTVRLQSTNALATIYSDNGVTTISQPLITDSSGRYEFYAANDRYKIEYDYNGTTTTIEDVSLLDINDVAIQNLVKATTAQAQAGTDDGAYMTAKKTRGSVEVLGLGNLGGGPDTPTLDVNTMGLTPSGVYRTVGNVANIPVGSARGNIFHFKRAFSTTTELDGSQMLVVKSVESVGQVLAFRVGNDIESSTVPFNFVYHSGNFLYAQNLSGATVSKDGTVSGASISPAKTGTWRNVSNVDCAVNEKTLFERVGAIV